MGTYEGMYTYPYHKIKIFLCLLDVILSILCNDAAIVRHYHKVGMQIGTYSKVVPMVGTYLGLYFSI